MRRMWALANGKGRILGVVLGLALSRYRWIQDHANQIVGAVRWGTETVTMFEAWLSTRLQWSLPYQVLIVRNRAVCPYREGDRSKSRPRLYRGQSYEIRA